MNPNFSRSVRESNSPTKPFFNLAAFECPGGSTINGLPNLLTAGCPESTPQNVGRFGDSGYNEVEGPGIIGWIWSITKEFRPLERVGLQFTANIANPFNHPNWAPPSTDLTTASTAGRISSTDQYGIDPFSLARRRISFQLKLVF
jgi:hypothetical protein